MSIWRRTCARWRWGDSAAEPFEVTDDTRVRAAKLILVLALDEARRRGAWGRAPAAVASLVPTDGLLAVLVSSRMEVLARFHGERADDAGSGIAASRGRCNRPCAARLPPSRRRPIAHTRNQQNAFFRGRFSRMHFCRKFLLLEVNWGGPPFGA